MSEARDIYIDRIKRELIGPGSDIFYCTDDFSDEIIEGKPLTRYYSGILFPPKTELIEDDPELFNEDNDGLNEEPDELTTKEKENVREENETLDNSEEDETFKLRSNLYFPTNIGLTFCIPLETNTIDLILNFGTYKKASGNKIKIKYNGEGVELLSQFGLQEYVEYDSGNKILLLKKELKGNRKKNQKSEDYLILDGCLKNFAKEISRDHTLLRHLKKLVYGKDKWQRFSHNYNLKIGIEKNNTFLLETLVNELENLPHNLAKGITLYVKVYSDYTRQKKIVKILLENKAVGVKAKKYLPTNEKLNESCLFQVELLINSEKLLPFDKLVENEFLSDEDKTLNFLYEDIKSYGIGHGAACEWELTDNPTWIKTSFFPHFDIKNQSTEFDFKDVEIEKILDIKNLSSFSQLNKNEIISGLRRFNNFYKEWIDGKTEEDKNRSNSEIRNRNILQCFTVFNRIQKGIKILEENNNAFSAFQFANSAMYMQMFHSARYFGNEFNKGFELFEWNERFQQKGIPNYADYETINFPSVRAPKWRPFQLGFILLSLRSIVEPTSEDRNLVDLIWFPTGGGKTEAYLTVTSLLIFYRRLVHKQKGYGVNAIIRYTLRLLTAQQFERASKVILACEKIRRENKTILGDEEITIGFWVGASTIPNSIDKAKDSLDRILTRLNNGDRANNIFQVNSCQWCNTKTITRLSKDDQRYKISIRANYLNQGIKAYCQNPQCDFSEPKNGFPIVLVDEDIYNKPPTLLFGTVDKFAMLAWRPEGRKLFNQHNDCIPPELIIQDELHLISGPLGSITGLYENVIQSLCEKKGISPKIIASTATSKNAENQVKRLYGRQITIFPPFALDTKNNFFSRTEEHSLRRYIGIMPTGKNFTMTQLKILAAMLYARLDVWQNADETIKKNADNFWTVVSYFNSLKDVGKMANKIGSELRDSTLKQLHNRLLNSTFANYRRLKFAQELTSRILSERIKETLDRLNIQFENDIENSRAIDLVLATNMISVGLDVQRLGVMLVNGMPRNIAEYIQSTSRVARKNKGVIFTLFNPDNSRDLSYFEHFVSFHQKFYKEIEPLSLTPFTENTFDRMLLTTIVTYFRHKLGNCSNDAVKNLNKEFIKNELNDLIEKHKGITDNEKNDFMVKVEHLLNYWEGRITAATNTNYKLKFKSNNQEESFLKTRDQIRNDEYSIMQSVRNVEPSTKIKINQY
ncbi:MAG: helicase C-terminal domain-containing protein [Melioribacteraceae bacterium]|nr:helicase C-terminal domain-containing protein [Melioribacteraceae bacterium]